MTNVIVKFEDGSAKNICIMPEKIMKFVECGMFTSKELKILRRNKNAKQTTRPRQNHTAP